MENCILLIPFAVCYYLAWRIDRPVDEERPQRRMSRKEREALAKYWKWCY